MSNLSDSLDVSNKLGNRSALLRRCECGALLHKFSFEESVTCQGCGGEWTAVELARVAPIT